MPVPYKERFFEDFSPGEVTEFGDYLVTEEEILEYATRYDPQPFHVDREAAAESMFGGLIASGWMTGSIMMRLLVEHFISPVSGMGSPGVDEVRWPKPVRAGDRLRVRITTIEAKRSQSKPDRGIIQVQQEMINQHGDTVMSLRGTSFLKCRTPAPV
jgi:acyl dehydratase